LQWHKKCEAQIEPPMLWRTSIGEKEALMLKQKIAIASLIAFVTLPALAEDAPKPAEAPKAPYTLSANVFLVSDYFFRGITQTWGKPAVQGGFDFAHDSGIYLGTWGSNVSGNQFPGGSLEWDLYGGYNYKINDDFTIGAGLLYYYYPGANFDKAAVPGQSNSLNTLEVNASATWKWLTFKFSYALTDYFGANTKSGFTDDTKGTYYPELNASYPLPWVEGLSAVGHFGYTHYAESLAANTNGTGRVDPSYFDWKLGVSYVWKDGWTVGAYYVDTTNKDYYKRTPSLANTDVKDLARGGGYITVGRTF
jgi:uncharacterized protein (TIGR02001 family)